MSTQYQTNLDQIDHRITINEANELIGRFQDNRNGIISGDFENEDPFTNCQTFNKDAITALLDQQGCVGLRSYFGMYNSSAPEDKQGKIVFVLCGVDEDGNDLNLSPSSSDTDQIILEDAQLCPPLCPATSKINNL